MKSYKEMFESILNHNIIVEKNKEIKFTPEELDHPDQNEFKLIKKGESFKSSGKTYIVTATSKDFISGVLKESKQKFDLSKVLWKSKPVDGEIFITVARDTTGMKGTQDEQEMYITDLKGRVIKDMGSHPSLKGSEKFAKTIGFVS